MPSPSTLATTAHAVTRRRVLVVDDEPSMAETVADGLVMRGFDAFAVASSRAAAAMLAHPAEGDPPIDALVTDLRMPELDGLELLAVSLRSDARRPVIVMTAYSALESAVESVRRGAKAYLIKPFKTDEIASALTRALAQR